MNIVRKSIIRVFSPESPCHFIGVLIYQFVYMLICSFWKWRFPTTLIWARNSYEAGDLVPGLSDIDLTVISTEGELPSYSLEVLGVFKEIFVILGEVNSYNPESLEIIKDIYNYYEIQRDPKLMSYFNLSKKPNEVDSTIYLMRTYESDKHNIENRIKFRKRKWLRVFQLLDIENEELSMSGLYTQLQKRIGERVLNNQMLYSPHTWLECNFQKLNDVHVKEIFSSLTESESLIIIGQIRWEIFGILTQLPFLANRKEMIYHFENLKIILSYLPSDQAFELKDIIGRAKQLV